MAGVSGRVALSVLLPLCLVLAVAVVTRPAAVAWTDGYAATQAVSDALSALARAADAPMPPLPGADAADPDARALDAALSRYLTALHGGQVEDAWGQIASDTTAPWTLKSWTEYLEGLRGDEADDGYGSQDVMQLLLGRKCRLGEVRTWGDAGACRVVLDTDLPAVLALVRTAEGWMVDLAGTDRESARLAAARQLASLGWDNATDLYRAAMMAAGESALSDYLTMLIRTPGMGLAYEVTERKVEGDRALVRLSGRHELNLRVPLINDDQGWSIAWSHRAQVMMPDEPLVSAETGTVAGRTTRPLCAANLKQLSLGMLMYCQDYDEKMPPADKWSRATEPYVRNDSVHHCPADDAEPYSYAMNYKLSRWLLSRVTMPAQTVMLFESSLHRPDAYDKGGYPGDSLAMPPRHGRENNYAFSDGHVTHCAPEVIGRDYYRVTGQQSGAPMPLAPGAPSPPIR